MGKGAMLSVAVIDGPYDAAALSRVLARPPVSLGDGSCGVIPSSACGHGTFIIGLLGARHNANPPGLCPDCMILHVPLFVDQATPSASLAALANAVMVAADAGARLVNLSLAILGDDARDHSELAVALDRAEASGAVMLVAAGNQGRLAMGQLLRHPVTVPVVAVDAAHRLLPDGNFGPLISRRGVAAIGQQVFGYAPGGGTTVMSGTSVATAVATGILAQIWSARPNVDGTAMRTAVARVGSRNGWTPPMLDRNVLLAQLDQIDMAPIAGATFARSSRTNYASLQGETTMMNRNRHPILLNSGSEPVTRPTQSVVPADGQGGCACGAPGGICTCANGASSSRFIYVLGTVDIRFPDQSISEELQSVARTLQIQQGNEEPLRSWFHKVLSHKTAGALTARHVARLLCWVLKVEGQVAYYLVLHDQHDVDGLIACLARPESDDPHDHDDLDLVVGSSSLAPVEIAPGVNAPILAVDQLCLFERDKLIDELFKPPPKRRRSSATRDSAGESGPGSADRLRFFRMLVQSADNFGDTDEWRALNYLAVRFKPIYLKYAEMIAANYDLESVKVATSRLWRDKHIVDPVFTFRHKETGVTQKVFVRLDVSHLYPMIVTELTDYFDR